MVGPVRARHDPQNEVLLAAFGVQLRAFRRAAKLSQAELARAARLHRTTVGGFERGRINPTLVALVALAEVLGCSPDELIAGLSRRPPDPGGRT